MIDALTGVEMSKYDDDPYYEHPRECPECGALAIMTEHECPPDEGDYGACDDDRPDNLFDEEMAMSPGGAIDAMVP